MNDIRSQLPECPLAYEVPFIPVNHTALVIPTNAADIDWQEKMLPWTLASLINNTDIVIEGVHLYIAYEDGTQDRIKTALSNFDFPPDLDPIIDRTTVNSMCDCYHAYHTLVLFNVNFWAFRDERNIHKLTSEDILKYKKSYQPEPYPDISQVSPVPWLYDMTRCTPAQFRHAIKHLLGAQLGITV